MLIITTWPLGQHGTHPMKSTLSSSIVSKLSRFSFPLLPGLALQWSEKEHVLIPSTFPQLALSAGSAPGSRGQLGSSSH